MGRADGAVQLAAALRQGADGRDAHAPAREASDYFVRQGTDPDGLAAELDTPEQAPPLHRHLLHVAVLGPPGRVHRCAAPPGRFGGSAVVDFHTEPFADGAKLRASFGGYESVFDRRGAQRAADDGAATNPTSTLVLFGPSDHVIYPDFDRMAAVVFPNHVGPFLLRDCGHFVRGRRRTPWSAASSRSAATGFADPAESR